MCRVAVTLPLTTRRGPGCGGGRRRRLPVAGERQVGWPQVGAAAGGAAAVGVVTLVVGRLAGLGLFGVVHLAYLGLTVSLPLVGLGLLALGLRRGSAASVRVVERGGRSCPRPWAPTPPTSSPTGCRSTWWPCRWTRHGRGPGRCASPCWPTSRPTTSATTSGGPWTRSSPPSPTSSCVPGDLYQGDRSELADDLPAMRRLLQRLEAPFGVYFVRGDADGGGSDEIQGSVGRDPGRQRHPDARRRGRRGAGAGPARAAGGDPPRLRHAVGRRGPGRPRGPSRPTAPSPSS